MIEIELIYIESKQHQRFSNSYISTINTTFTRLWIILVQSNITTATFMYHQKT